MISIKLKSMSKARRLVFDAVQLSRCVTPDTMPPLNAPRQLRPPSRYSAADSLSSTESSTASQSYIADFDPVGCRTLMNLTKHSSCLDVQLVPPPDELLNITSCLILVHWPRMKIGRYSQNRKCITYCNAVRGESSHGHNMHKNC